MLKYFGVLLVIGVLVVAIISFQKTKAVPNEKDLLQVKSTSGDKTKKVILIVVDSLMATAIDKGIMQKELPTFQYLIKHGQYYKDLVSSFPTMSVTIDSSLLTGTYPDGHHIPGLTWYSAKDTKLINYGTGPMEVIKLGVNPVLEDALIHLNGKHLNPEQTTIYDDLAKEGKKSGSINGLIYRGPVKHTLSVPLWMDASTSLPQSLEVKGPDLLALGSFSDPLTEIEKPDGLTHRMGINNQYSLLTAEYLIKNNKLPDFLYIYLPDLDKKLHKHGPNEQNGIKATDQQLQSLLQSFGSLEEALNQAIIVIVGDSGMSKVLPADDNPVIELSSLLKDYQILRQEEGVAGDTEIVLAVNETMAYIYSLKSDKLKDIASNIRTDQRIDIISWKEGEWINVIGDEIAEVLRYKMNGNLTDPYGQKWTVEQAPDVLDLSINSEDQTIRYGKYPDVLRRLYGALHSHSGEFLVVTAKPGYELADKNSPSHKGGGSHGAFGHAESLVPLIISGTDAKPEHLRMVDLKAYLMKLVTKQQPNIEKGR
ncbi:alkaline phosphatase family protein [Paenibacillus lentus]|uniref:Alkaline phosphatase family protein n=1 Tax=Paenibacillus lentus TaxID=1338368 RepID=A0A3S8RWY2_9BACL|nr:alkaline phosphatase family protein [Paenibacillus lentus]AZK47478.1 alkaline phosphatase family protein [Paenibacillus lentus]